MVATSGLRQVLRALHTLLKQRDFRVVVTCSTVMGLAISFVYPFMSLFATREAKMSLGVFGAFMTFNALCNIGISTALANRSDARYSRRAMLLLGTGAGALGYLGYAFARDLWQLTLIGAVVMGVASVTFSQLFAYARELLERSEVPQSEAPLYMNAIRMSFALSWTVGPAIAASGLRYASFKALFCAASALYVLFMFLVWRYVPAGAVVRATQKQDSLGVLALFRHRSLLAWFVAFVLVLGAHTISMSNMSLYVLEDLHGDEANVGVVFSLAPLFELPFMLYFGLLATRVDSTRLIRIAIVLAVVYYALLSCVRAPYQIYPLQLLSAAIVSVTGGVAITFFQNKLPERLGAATNLYSNASRVGSTSAYVLFGSVAGQLGHRGTYVLCAAMTVLALLLSVVPDKVETPALGAR
ncbi:MAG: sugar efflux transporter [Polyangiaceae bacterium]